MTAKKETAGVPASTPKTRRGRARPVYMLEELLAECHFTKPYSAEERAFLHAQPVGREEI